MKLQSLPLDVDPESTLPDSISRWVQIADERMQQFWDSFSKRPIEQYVACDFDYVAKALYEIDRQKLLDGNRFCEWGCGFGIVAGIASLLGWDAVGIEAEPFLVQQGKLLLERHGVSAELYEGNFLPRQAKRWVPNSSQLVSLFQHIPPAYEEMGMEIDDFAIIFAYPWPGEEYFFQEVFLQAAREGALCLLFRGPYQLELYRKLGSGPRK
jgi:hypothetical protein